MNYGVSTLIVEKLEGFMKFKIVESNEEVLEDLYKDNSFTFEGLNINDAQELADFFEEKNTLKSDLEELEIYHTKGSLMNSYYNLTGSNRYPEDLDIVSIKLTSFDPDVIGMIAILKMQIGARWFNDIVDNNARRELER